MSAFVSGDWDDIRFQIEQAQRDQNGHVITFRRRRDAPDPIAQLIEKDPDPVVEQIPYEHVDPKPEPLPVPPAPPSVDDVLERVERFAGNGWSWVDEDAVILAAAVRDARRRMTEAAGLIRFAIAQIEMADAQHEQELRDAWDDGYRAAGRDGD